MKSIRNRNVKIQLWLNKAEARNLQEKARRSHLSVAAYLRQLISGVVPKEAPSPDFFSMMRELHYIGNNLNTSFVILDPKGELLRDTGHLLEEKGYVIKVLDLINPERSHCYNPFVYLRDDDDIQRLATNIMKNTTPKDSKSSDHFWEDMAAMLLKALISYLHYEAPPEEQNFPMVMDMIRAGDVKEDNEEYVSTLDELFERLERKNPEHIAVRYYKGYHSGSGDICPK